MTETGRKMLGVIGGVGPLATAYFMEVIINKTKAVTDQEHIDMVVLNHAEIPDRTEYILDHSKPDPSPMMCADAKKLEMMGADMIATPCNTAHYFYEKLSAAVKVPVLNMIEETALELFRLGAKRAGILATNGTAAAGLFQQALGRHGIEAVTPDAKNQQYVMEIIFNDVKAGRPLETEKFKSVVDEMRLYGCDHVVLGCTELSVLKKEYSLGDYYLDALEVLASRAIEACGREVRPD